MGSIWASTTITRANSLPLPERNPISKLRTSAFNFKLSFRSISPLGGHFQFPSTVSAHSSSNQQSNEEESEALVQELRIPGRWLDPTKALEESEWLRVTLHKWLDEEYCPEATNIEISKVAAQSYYRSLVAKQTDLGDILLKMATELETISYKESFHGAFSSANAAVNLIIQRIEHD